MRVPGSTKTASDVAKYDKRGASGDTKDAAQAYLSMVEPASLVDQAAWRLGVISAKAGIAPYQDCITFRMPLDAA